MKTRSTSLTGLPQKKITTGLKRLQEAGITPAQWLRMLDAVPAQLQRIVEAWPIAETDSQARCRELFGTDFFGIPEATGAYGYGFSAEETENRKSVCILGCDGALLSEQQSWDAIRRCHEEAPGLFALCAGVPHSVCDVYGKHTDVFHPDLRKNPWFGESGQRRLWSERKLQDFWFLLEKDVTLDSWDKSSSDQEQWLSKNHPSRQFAAPEHVVYGSVLCCKATQGRFRLYGGERWCRTLQRAVRGRLVLVRFLPKGLFVDSDNAGAYWDSGVPSLWTS